MERSMLRCTRMKSKTCMSLVMLVLAMSGLVWLITMPSPHIQSLVSKTQLHIKNINSQLNVLNDPADQYTSDVEVDAAYLELLGFVSNPRLFTQHDPQQAHQQQQQQQQLLTGESNSKPAKQSSAVRWRIPPLVTAFVSFGDKERALVESKLAHFRTDLFIVYDLDLSSSEQLKVKKLCNVSCVLRTFKSNKYNRLLFCIIFTKLSSFLVSGLLLLMLYYIDIQFIL